MKKSEFVGMIREIVAKEVRRQLPKVVTETYLRRLIGESVRPVDEDYEEHYSESTPRPLENSDLGIYQTSPLVHNESRRVVSKLLGDGNPMAFLYEGVQPMGRQATGRVSEADLVRQAAIESGGEVAGGDSRYAQIFRRTMEQAPSRGPMQQLPAAREREIEMRRKRLDERVIDTSRRPVVK